MKKALVIVSFGTTYEKGRQDIEAVERVLTSIELKAPEKYLGRHQKLNDQEWSNMFGAANHAAVEGD